MQSRAENAGLSARALKMMFLGCAAITGAATFGASQAGAQTFTDSSDSCLFYFDPANPPAEEDLNRIVCQPPMIDTNRPLAALDLPNAVAPAPPVVPPGEEPNEPPGEPNEPPGNWPPHDGGNWPHFPPVSGEWPKHHEWEWPKHHDWDWPEHHDWPKHHDGDWPKREGDWPKDHAWDWHKDKDKRDKWDGPSPPHDEIPSLAHNGWTWGDGKHDRHDDPGGNDMGGIPVVTFDSHAAGSFGLAAGGNTEGWSHEPAGQQASANAGGGFAGFGSIQGGPLSATGGLGAAFSGFGGLNTR